MRKIRNHIPILFTLTAALVLILDARTAAKAAADAVQMCLQTAIPSLFPFFVLSGILVPYASEFRLPFLGRLLHIPDGLESIFLLGCVGGYPVGAQCVAQCYASGKLNDGQAQRMLGFCTNCGPSFLFGIVGCAFSGPKISLAVMLIGIFSAILTGAFWPGIPMQGSTPPDIQKITLPQSVQQALRSIASVCAWIILGKMLLEFLRKWVLWLIPKTTSILLTGIIELTNGALELGSCPNEDLRFIIACGICSFGGLCVALQVMSICQLAKLDAKYYLPEKATQAAISVLLAIAYLHLPFASPVNLTILGASSIILQQFAKKMVEIPTKMVYNIGSKGGM